MARSGPPGADLTGQQELAATVLAAGGTRAEAAAAAGCSERTITRWSTGNPQFRSLTHKLRRAALEEAAGVLTGHARELAQRVIDIALLPSSATVRDRLSAAIAGLRAARDLHSDADLADRLAAVEGRLEDDPLAAMIARIGKDRQEKGNEHDDESGE